MHFDPFIIPFDLGLYFIIIYAVVRSVIWFKELSRPDKLRLQRGFFGKAFGHSIKEIFLESLIHRKILRKNFRLGYMHMSLAFGWFLLILFGTFEADIFGESHLNAPYKAIFFRFFNPDHGKTGFENFYSFLMDFILAFVLSGLLLAVIKRFTPKALGLKKTTRLKPVDKIALTALWLIFPARLVAESLTCGAYGTGSFLTGSLGSWFASFLPAHQLAYPFWWLYSLSLGTFFILLPLTRYQHIPTELFLIFMRNSGIRTGDRTGAFSEVQVFSCSSCGMCIDQCQMNFSAGITNMQSVYMLKAIRNNGGSFELSQNCLMCGRCEVNCPVGIELLPIRMTQRRDPVGESAYRNIWRGYFRKKTNGVAQKSAGEAGFNYLPPAGQEKADLLYFAGCMSHLTPGIIKSMTKILDASGLNWSFMDEAGGVCCGRPLMLAGQDREARELMNYNSQMIIRSGAQTLVTSCPICYKIFSESYHLGIEVLHHTQLIKEIIDNGRIKLRFLHRNVVYHAPCELGRGSGIYEEPKEVLKYVACLEKTPFEDENSLCCGGSLGNIRLGSADRRRIAANTASQLTLTRPDNLATACPLCKKTLASETSTRVTDICEIVAEALVGGGAKTRSRHRQSFVVRESAGIS